MDYQLQNIQDRIREMEQDEKTTCRCNACGCDGESLSNELIHVLAINDYVCDECVCSLTIEKAVEYWPMDAEKVIEELNIES